MPNTLGTLNTGLVLSTVLDLATKVHPVLTRIVTDFSAVPAKKDQTIYVRTSGKPTVQDFGSSASTTAMVDAPVQLALHKEVRYQFTAAEVAATDRNLLREVAMPMAMAVGDYLAGIVATQLTTVADYATEVGPVSATALDYEWLTEGSRVLTETKEAPKNQRFALVSPTGYKSLLNDPLCNRAQKSAGDDPIATGRLAGIAGFDEVAEFQSFPTTDNAIGVVAHKSACLLAVRPPANPADVFNVPFSGNIGIVTSPDSTAPFSVLAYESINNSTLAVETVMVFLAGVDKGTDFAARIVSA